MENKIKKLDNKTFGASPAAIYLAKVLNDLKNEKLNAKAGKFLSVNIGVLSELEISHELGLLSTRNLSMLVSNIKKNINFDSKEILVKNLVENILNGKISAILRKLQKLRMVQIQQNKKFAKEKAFTNKMGLILSKDENGKIVQPRYYLSDMITGITDDSLREKWKERMKRRGIQLEENI